MIDKQLINEIYEATVVIRNTISPPMIGSSLLFRNKKNREDIKKIAMKLEGLRVDLRLARQFPEESIKSLSNAFDIFTELLNEPALESLFDIRLRGMMANRERELAPVV